ncbi:UDP-Glycosyltransferase superfamily protein [Striga asiatica]|uniref:Glycosyltransferase n=1 Tax=Striga asiatica TaxID=4170 RepID=A0A5A7PIQ9_STRAF|nr:UDP-Glycosyltransferase superfamily protein [Striga asiatica]
MDSPHPHVLLVTLPAQGHINPSLRFAKRLLNMGIEVTFATSIHARHQMEKTAVGPTPDGLSFAPFSDGFDNGFIPNQDDHKRHMTEIKIHGSRALRDTILKASEMGRPVTCLVYTLLLPWASTVAREFQIPCALLWIQPATVLDLYYYYFDGAFGDISSVRLPGLSHITFSKRDLPSLLLPTSDMYHLVLPAFKEQFDTLNIAETRPKVLVNTFDALEPGALRAIERYDVIGVGPLVDADIRGDLFGKSEGCIEWLDSKPKSSVVYVSFGSLVSLEKAQMEEIAGGLLGSGRPFLWVARESVGWVEELVREQGKIVGWCQQMEVLGHESVGCFVTHCGWNSTLESLWCGVPVVAFPVWSDQGTNAKMIEEEWGTGVRVGPGEDGKVSGEEITRCIERVMEGGEKMRENAGRWKGLAREALAENGSSYRNLEAFFKELELGHLNS